MMLTTVKINMYLPVPTFSFATNLKDIRLAIEAISAPS